MDQNVPRNRVAEIMDRMATKKPAQAKPLLNLDADERRENFAANMRAIMLWQKREHGRNPSRVAGFTTVSQKTIKAWCTEGIDDDHGERAREFCKRLGIEYLSMWEPQYRLIETNPNDIDAIRRDVNEFLSDHPDPTRLKLLAVLVRTLRSPQPL